MKEGAVDHPKILALASALHVRHAEVVGIMECLWRWTRKYAPQGDAGRHEASGIAAGAKWEGDPEVLIEALVGCRWLDRSPDGGRGELLVHDWPEHCEDAVHMSLARAGKLFADGTVPKLTKLSKDEQARLRPILERAHGVRTACAQEAHNVRTAVAVALPLPCPTQTAAATAAAAVAPADAGTQEQQQTEQSNPPEAENFHANEKRLEFLAKTASAMSARPWEEHLRQASTVSGSRAYMRPGTISRASPEWVDRTEANLRDQISEIERSREQRRARECDPEMAARIQAKREEFYRNRDAVKAAARAP